MQNSNRNYLTAGILIFIGLIFLGREFNLFTFHWGDIARFWPLLLVFMGLNLLVGGKSKSGTGIFILLCFLALPFAMVRSCRNNWHNGNRFHWNNNHNWDEENDNEDENDGEDNKNNSDNSHSQIEKSQNFAEDLEPNIKEAKLTIEGGVAGIDIDGTTGKLFEADTKSTFSDFSVSKTVENGVANIRFSMNSKDKETNIHLSDENKNEAKIKLNPSLAWDMDYKFGVSGADLDLSPFNVKNINIKTGVSGVDMKLGDKATDTNVDIDAGIAGITIKVPENVGVRIKSDSFLSDNNFKDFTEQNGYHVSPGYDKSNKKITINYHGAFASFDVERY
jgi:Domain of unknown function (DUF5668)/Cell wall-active antibiotics response 4TMS YvqF